MKFQIRSHMITRLLLTTLLLTLASAVSLAAPAPGNPMALPSDAELSGAASAKLGPPSAQAADAQQFAQRVQEMSRRYAPIEFDPDLRAKSLGNGIEPILKYVRDEMRFESYPGIFRGAKGAYLSRAANAADRSLLLAQMLKANAITCRFATGQLPPEQCQILFGRMFEPSRASTVPTGLTTTGDFAQRVRTRALHDYALIHEALKGKTFAAAMSDTPEILREISSHVWVEAHVGDKWVALDSAFPDA